LVSIEDGMSSVDDAKDGNSLDGERFFISVCVEQYSSDRLNHLPIVPDESAEMTALMHSLGYTAVLGQLRHSPTAADFKTTFRDWLSNRPEDARDMLMFYFTGHAVDDGDRQYLLLSDSSLDDLDGTAIAVEDLARW